MRAQCGSVWPSVWLCAAAALSPFAKTGAQTGAQTGNLARPVSVGRFETAPVSAKVTANSRSGLVLAGQVAPLPNLCG
jgi:hypothetical protein